MYKYFVILFLVIAIIFLSSLRYNYVQKDENFLYVSSKGKAYEWNKKFFDTFLLHKYPEKNVIHANISNPDILLVSHFLTYYDKILYTEPTTPVITWSGENFLVKGYPNAVYNFVSQSPSKETDVWLPYLIVAHFEMGKGVDKIVNKNYKPIEEREKFVAYIASNQVKEREELFKILLSKKLKGTDALGKCSNNSKKVDGDFTALDDVYENYIFGFAMENCVKDGYITEKILNVFNGGAIPVYWGDSNSVSKFFNKGSYIDVNDFESLSDVADYLCELSKDTEALKKIKKIDVFKNREMFENLNFILNY